MTTSPSPEALRVAHEFDALPPHLQRHVLRLLQLLQDMQGEDEEIRGASLLDEFDLPPDKAA